MARPADNDPDDDADDHADDAQSGDVPEGVGADLYATHLEHLRRHEAYQDAVLSFPDAEGRKQDIPLDQVTEIEEPSRGGSRGKIRLRNGAIVLASGAVIAAAIAALRYRRARK
ncbi:MAG: hypothetical protein M3046_10735 [Actinomycetota bacterium]|jgi:hypothetical protein|nr:hypothetical protein [Actinomycetota bacterium]